MAQSDIWRSEVRAMFAPDVKNLWIQHLKGNIAGIHNVDFILGTDGKSCKGLYVLRSSQLKFYFEGEDSQEHIELTEHTRSGRITGYISGNYDGKNLSAVWNDVGKSQKLPIRATLAGITDAEINVDCDTKEWVAKYEGRIANEQIIMTIHKRNENFNCLWFVGGKSYSEEIKYSGKNKIYNLTNRCPLLKDKKMLISGETATTNKAIEILDNSEVFKLLQVFFLPFECYEFADFTTRMELIKPKTGNIKFNYWLEQKFKSWFNENQKRKQHNHDHEYATTERWKHNVYGWVEVSLFSPDILCGTIYRQSTQEAVTSKSTFIFDLSGGKELLMQDVFDKNFNAGDYISKVISAKKKEMELSPDIKNWADKDNFKYYTFNLDGMKCKSDFHPVYGELEILISYRDMTPNIRSKSLLKEINHE